MFLHNLKWSTPFFSPDDSTSGSGPIEDKTLDKESLINFLGEEDGQQQETLELEESDKKSSKDKEEESEEGDKKGKEGKEDELSLEDELEEELKEPDEEDEVDLIAPPARKEILAAYPDIFKKFPYIEQAMYREKKYAELLPTIKDAKEAVEKSKQLDQIEGSIMKGSTESLLQTVFENDRESFHKIVDNYMGALFKVDSSSYYHLVGNLIKQTVISMARDSKERNDEELGTAAAVLNNYIFNTTQFTQPTKLSRSGDPQDDESKSQEAEIDRREREFREKQFTAARDSLSSTVDNIVKSTVDKAIDPTNSMTEKIRQSAVREVLEGLDAALQKDTRFKVVFDKLWEKAFTSDFNSESLDRIKRAYLSKAKTLLPYLVRKARTEFLKGTIRRPNDNDNKDRKGHLPVGKTRSSTTLTSGSANKSNTAKAFPKGMTTLEFLNSDD